MRTYTALTGAAAIALGSVVLAQSVPPATMPAATQPLTQPLTVQPSTTQPAATQPTAHLAKVTVTADLDQPRYEIAPPLGAQTYTLTQDQIQDTPQGENAPFQQVLLRAPGVVPDSFGQEHVRGEHANLTYRVNGVLLPEPIAVFGQELDTHLIDSVTLIDGTLPAQFGFHTAGIVDVQTKSGDTLDHNEFSVYGGSYDTLDTSLQLGGSSGKLDYFVTTSQNHSDLGIENPTPSHRPLHDYTDQEREFTYLSYRIDDTSRISLLVNASYADFQIPNTSGLSQLYTLADHPTADSATTNEQQNEQEYYTVVSYQKTLDKFSFQLSGFTRYGQITFNPDDANDLIFQGVGAAVYNSYMTNGVQLDSSLIANDQHTIRAGLIADYTTEKNDTSSAVFPANPLTGAQTSDQPQYIGDNTGNRALEGGMYLQDEWRLNRQFTLNYGARYDVFDANFDEESQLSPRANLVWKFDPTTTLHAGYARYFVPPPVQDIALSSIEKFTNTTNAPGNLEDGPPKVERSNTYDVGISKQVTKPWEVGVDGFIKDATNLIDLGQFGDAVILSPYNYAHGRVYGAELSNTYKDGGFSAFANFSWVLTEAHDIDSQQFEIPADELAYIQDHNIHLDHESEYTVSAGAAYAWTNDRVYIDFLYGSGLRSGFANTTAEPGYYPINLGYEHVVHLSGKQAVRFRLDVINVFDESYQIRSGTGLGVNAAQYGERRAVLAGMTYEF